MTAPALSRAQDSPEPAIAAIEAVGGLASHDEHAVGRPVTEVTFYQPVADEQLELLRAFPVLQSLTVCEGTITDAGLARIAGLPGLKGLHVCRSAITDAGLEHLKRLPRLEWLTLSEVPVTDAGLVHLETLPRVRTIELRHTDVSDAGAAKLKEALPYAIVLVESGADAENVESHPNPFPLVAGAIALLGGAAALFLLRCPWPPLRRRRWLYKLPVTAAAISVTGVGLLQLAPVMNPVQPGDAATFWLHACGIDVGAKRPELYYGFYQPRDGWFIYYNQGVHERYLYRVAAPDALALFSKVVARLGMAPPGALHPDVEEGFRAWLRTDPSADDAAGLLAKLREARLERLRLSEPGLYEYVLPQEDEFGERWGRVQRYSWNVRFEFLFLAGLILFAAWPWLRGSGRWRWVVHLGLLPVFLFVPYWLGYAPMTFTSRGPSGGVLYPWLIMEFRGLPWTSLDTAIVKRLPYFLEPLTQTPGPIMSLTRFGGVGPVAATVMGAAVGLAVFIVGKLIARHRPADALLDALGAIGHDRRTGGSPTPTA